MTWLIFLQVILDLGLLLGLFLVWARLSRPAKEDIRLSKGLQLLQSKIAILEDLSDRTDVQVRQLSALLAAKAVEVHQKTAEADRQIQAIEKNMQKSLELSKIFQDKIPHREIIERETSYKYIQAARMANQGKTAEDISRHLEIPIGEVEVIINMNKDQLIFKEEEVPVWARPEMPQTVEATSPAISPLKEFGTMAQEEGFISFQNPISESGNSYFTQDEASVMPTVNGQPVSIDLNAAVRPYEFPKIDSFSNKPRI